MWCCGEGIFSGPNDAPHCRAAIKLSTYIPTYIHILKPYTTNETLLSTRFDDDKAPFPCMVCVMLMVELACEYTSYLHHKRGGTCRNVSHGWKLGYIKHPFTRPH